MTTIPLFPLGRALFPDGVLHLRIFEVRYLDMIRHCLEDKTPFGVVPLISGKEIRSPEGGEVLARAGTLAHIETWQAPMPSLFQLRCRGGHRFKLLSSEQGRYGLWTGQIEEIDDDPPQAIPDALRASADRLGRLIADLQREGTPASAMPLAPPFRLDECGWVANRWGELLPLSPRQQEAWLMEPLPSARLEMAHDALQQHGLLR